MSGKVTMQDVESSEMLKSLQVRLKSLADAAESESSTTKLWLTYMHVIDIMRDFIRSERTGDWRLHLSTMQENVAIHAGVRPESIHEVATYLPAEDDEVA